MAKNLFTISKKTDKKDRDFHDLDDCHDFSES